MKRLLALGLIVLVATTLALAQSSRSTIYSRPAVPAEDVLRRLNLKLAWSRYVPMEGRRDGFTTLEVVGKDVLAQTRSGLVVRLDAETGVIHWRQRVGRPYLGGKGLAYNSRSVYAVNATDLYSLSRATGEQRWRYRLPAGSSAVPLADERNLYLSTATGRMIAYFLPFTDVPVPPTAESEKEEESEAPRPILRWSAQTNASLELPPLQTRTRLLVLTPNGELHLIEKDLREVEEAAREETFLLRGRVDQPAGQFGDVAYIGSIEGNLYALDIDVGRLLWRFTAGSAITRQPMALENDVFVAVKRDGLVRVNRVDVTEPGTGRKLEAGQEVWRNRAAERFVASNKKFVYASDFSGRLLVLDRKRGTKLSMLDTRHYRFPVSNTTTDRIYLASHDGLIVCLHDRGYPRPLNHREEEDRDDPMKKKLRTPVTDPGGKEQTLRTVVTQFEAKYKLRFRVFEDGFKKRGIENVMDKKLKMPKVTKLPLEEYLAAILLQVPAIIDVVGDTIFIIPRPIDRR